MEYKDIYSFIHNEVITELLPQALNQKYVSSDKSGDPYVSTLHDSLDVRSAYYKIHPKPWKIIASNGATYFTKKFDAHSYEVFLQVNVDDKEKALSTTSMYRIYAHVFQNKMGKLAILFEGSEFIGEFLIE
jgi:hypothetical protein